MNLSSNKHVESSAIWGSETPRGGGSKTPKTSTRAGRSAGANHSSVSSLRNRSQHVTYGDERASEPLIPDEQTSIHSEERSSLMALGIELDEELIERLQKNLGIQKIFQVANKTANLIKKNQRERTKEKSSTDKLFSAITMNNGETAEMAYRNVSESTEKRRNNTALNSSITQPWQGSDTGGAGRSGGSSSSILRDFSQGVYYVEPQYRPVIEKILDEFRTQYARAPRRFVCRLLGVKGSGSAFSSSSSSRSLAGGGVGKGLPGAARAASVVEEEEVSRMVLRQRYMDATEFAQMMGRVFPSASKQIVAVLFKMLSEGKTFDSVSGVKRFVVDVWALLALLKSASLDGRRSFDNNKSRVANDVEFWMRQCNSVADNRGGILPGDSAYQQAGERRAASVGRRGNFRKYSKQQFERTHSYKTYSDDQQQLLGIEHGEREQKGDREMESEAFSMRNLSVARLLGNAQSDAIAQQQRLQRETRGGKCVRGTIHSERVNSCDVPTALNSPIRNRNPAAEPVHFRPNTLINEAYNQTSVSAALGKPEQDERYLSDVYQRDGAVFSEGADFIRPASPSKGYRARHGVAASEHHHRTRSQSTGRQLSGVFSRPSTLINESQNKTSVAMALGSGRENVFPPEGTAYQDGRYYLPNTLVLEELNRTTVAQALGYAGSAAERAREHVRAVSIREREHTLALRDALPQGHILGGGGGSGGRSSSWSGGDYAAGGQRGGGGVAPPNGRQALSEFADKPTRIAAESLLRADLPPPAGKPAFSTSHSNSIVMPPPPFTTGR